MKCEIIRDLLPLYLDEVCSDESKKAVEEHMDGCPDCAALLASLRESEPVTTEERHEDIRQAQSILGIRRKFLKKKRRSILATVLVMVVLFLGITAAADVERPVPYTDGMITAKLASDEVIDLYYQGDNYAAVRGMSRRVDGKNAVVLCYTWNLKSQAASLPERPHACIGNGLLLDTVKGTAVQVAREVEAVYYLAGDYDRLETLTAAEFETAMEGGVLLWSR